MERSDYEFALRRPTEGEWARMRSISRELLLETVKLWEDFEVRAVVENAAEGDDGIFFMKAFCAGRMGGTVIRIAHDRIGAKKAMELMAATINTILEEVKDVFPGLDWGLVDTRTGKSPFLSVP